MAHSKRHVKVSLLYHLHHFPLMTFGIVILFLFIYFPSCAMIADGDGRWQPRGTTAWSAPALWRRPTAPKHLSL